MLTISFLGCQTSSTEKDKIKPMVYEGMSRMELINVIGTPLEIDSSGSIYDVQSDTQLRLEKWRYDKRLVVLLNDTVRNAHAKVR